MTERRKSSRRAQGPREAWFEALRDDLCAAFEQLELDLPAGAPLAGASRRPVRAHALDAAPITPAQPVAAAS